jgi:hypothetical protein
MTPPRLPIDVEPGRLADICHRHAVRELALFGSVLRPDFRPDSDVDILVTFEPDARIGLLAFSELREELEALLGRNVDLVPRDGLSRHIRDGVLASAVVLHAA